jgi:hypothetical protein
MNEAPVDVRTPLAVSPSARVEVGEDGTLHVLVGPVTLHVHRHLCEELTTTLAVAMVRLHERDEKRAARTLHLVAAEGSREPSC